jgi:uncharacterized protein (TIGR02145 family)
MKLPFAKNWIIVSMLIMLFYACEKDGDQMEENMHYIITPAGEEAFIKGGDMQIEWHDETSDLLRLKLYKSDIKVANISSSIDNTGVYFWEIPIDIPDSNDYKVKIFSNADDFLFYESITSFAIVNIPDTSSFVDPRDGIRYKTVKIGEQWWMAENLKYEGSTGTYCGYGGTSCIGENKFYTFPTADDVCPPGWHLPTDDEWKELESYLGISDEFIHGVGTRGKNIGLLLGEGGELKFNAEYDGYYSFWWNRSYYQKTYAVYWTASPVDGENTAYARRFTKNAGTIERIRMRRSRYALSVRCVKD